MGELGQLCKACMAAKKKCLRQEGEKVAQGRPTKGGTKGKEVEGTRTGRPA
jgi:hypothetical protein